MVIIIMEIMKIFSKKNNFNINFSIDIALVSFQCKLHTLNSVTGIQSKTSNKCNAVHCNALLQPTNAQIYITIFSLYIMSTPACFDTPASSSASFRIFYFVKLGKF